MAGPNEPPLGVDTEALNTFANTLRGESQTIGGLQSGLADAAGALPGTQWSQSCIQARDSVDQALQRIGARLTTIADGVQQAGKAVELTDQQFGDKLTSIGLRT